MDFKKLKILLINHSDSRGGAAVVTHRLMEALCAEGIDARMLAVHKDSSSLRVDTAAGPKRARLPFLAEHAEIFLHNGHRRDTLFKISTARFGLPLHKHPWVKSADVIILNWVNQGMLSLSEIRRIAAVKPVIWTMHDQWNMTGVCHYTDNCRNYLTGCDNCHLLPKSSLAAKVFTQKLKLYHDIPIHFVAVSNRLAQLCRKSPLMVDAAITVIPNAIPANRFHTTPAQTRLRLGLPEGKRIVVMGAARLDDPVKNLPLAIDALNALDGPSVFPVFFGDLRNPKILERLNMPHLWLKKISSQPKLQSILAHSDIILSTSVWETLPGTIIEGIACGAVAVTTDNGGQEDIVRPGVTGFIAPISEADSDSSRVGMIAEALREALLLPQDKEARDRRHHLIAAKFGAPAIARAYLRLISTQIGIKD